MEKSEIGPQNFAGGKVGKYNRRDVAAFVFFLFLSFLFWFLNSLDKETESGLRLPVKFTNIPSGRQVTEDTQAMVSLDLRGSGYSILKLKLAGKSVPVLIDISQANYRRVTENSSSRYFILTEGLTKSFSSQLRTDCEIISIKPDTIWFRMERTFSGLAKPPEPGGSGSTGK